MNGEERRKYFNSLNKYRTNLSVMQNEHDEGRNEMAIEIARLMLQEGESIEKIAHYTGLTPPSYDKTDRTVTKEQSDARKTCTFQQFDTAVLERKQPGFFDSNVSDTR